jgi:SAM-dependent methyltransferase
MPYSHAFFKQDIKIFFDKTLSRSSKILDVGPGNGTYSSLLSPLGFKLDCLEIFEPYIHQYELQKKYSQVFLGDIRDFDFSNYDFIIMGDVLEHLSVDDSTNILNKIYSENRGCLVAVPYLCEQGTMEENVHETHLQPELTPELVIKQYPQLELLAKNQYYGYYINRQGDDSKYWDLDRQEFVTKKTPSIYLNHHTDEEVHFSNETNQVIYVKVTVSSEVGVHYETNMELQPGINYFVSVPVKVPKKKVTFVAEGINKYYYMN